MEDIVYKICTRAEWDAALAHGRFEGSAVDVADGFIHFSTAEQAGETARRHFAGQRDLVLVAVDTENLDGALKWEPSRGGDLFPHLYAPLPVTAAIWAKDLLLDADGAHDFPDLEP